MRMYKYHRLPPISRSKTDSILNDQIFQDKHPSLCSELYLNPSQANMPATTSSMLSTLLLAIPLLFPSTAAAVAVVKKDVTSAVVVASEAALVDAAVTFTSFPSRSECLSNQSGTRYANPDAGCYHLPGQSMDVNGIAGGCRGMYYYCLLMVESEGMRADMPCSMQSLFTNPKTAMVANGRSVLERSVWMSRASILSRFSVVERE